MPILIFSPVSLFMRHPLSYRNLFKHWSFSRLLVQSICLTGSDLNSSSKPWDIQVKTTQVVYEEFHDQVNNNYSIYTAYVHSLYIKYPFEFEFCYFWYESCCFVKIANIYLTNFMIFFDKNLNILWFSYWVNVMLCKKH